MSNLRQFVVVFTRDETRWVGRVKGVPVRPVHARTIDSARARADLLREAVAEDLKVEKSEVSLKHDIRLPKKLRSFVEEHTRLCEVVSRLEQQLRQARADAVHALRDEHYSIRDIGALLGVKKEVVCNHLPRASTTRNAAAIASFPPRARATRALASSAAARSRRPRSA